MVDTDHTGEVSRAWGADFDAGARLKANLSDYAKPPGESRPRRARGTRTAARRGTVGESAGSASLEAAPAPAEPATTAHQASAQQEPAPARPRTNKATATGQTEFRSSTTIPGDVWMAVAHYCTEASVSRTRLMMRALAATKERHRELVQQGRGQHEAAQDDAAALELFGLSESELPARRGGTEPKKQLPFYATHAMLETIDDLVRQAGAADRSELLTVVLRDYLAVDRR